MNKAIWLGIQIHISPFIHFFNKYLWSTNYTIGAGAIVTKVTGMSNFQKLLYLGTAENTCWPHKQTNKMHTFTMNLICHWFFPWIQWYPQSITKVSAEKSAESCMHMATRIHPHLCVVMSLFLQASPKQLRSCIQAAEIWLCIARSVSFNLGLNVVGRAKDRGATWRKKQAPGLQRRKVMQTIEAEDCAALDELLGIQKPQWPLRNFTKILIFRDGQYTRHLWRSRYSPSS